MMEVLVRAGGQCGGLVGVQGHVADRKVGERAGEGERGAIHGAERAGIVGREKGFRWFDNARRFSYGTPISSRIASAKRAVHVVTISSSQCSTKMRILDSVPE